jgi:acetate kinase
MAPANPHILTINGGSSSIKFALFEAGDSLRRILEGGIERIGLPAATLRVKGLEQTDNFLRSVTTPDHAVAVGALMDWIDQRIGRNALTAVGHRVVHGGPKYHIKKNRNMTTNTRLNKRKDCYYAKHSQDTQGLQIA